MSIVNSGLDEPIGLIDRTLDTVAAPTEPSLAPEVERELAEYARWLDAAIDLVDGETGDLVRAVSTQPCGDWMLRGALCREAARRGEVTVIEDHDGLLVLALPVVEWVMPPGAGRNANRRPVTHVGVAQFVTRPHGDDCRSLAAALGLSPAAARRWAAAQRTREPQALLATARLVAAKLAAERRTHSLVEELDAVADNLSSSYEELSLLYRVTENLRLSGGAEQIAQMAMQWLTDVIPAEGFAVQLTLSSSLEVIAEVDRVGPVLLREGNCPVDRAGFQELLGRLPLEGLRQPLVLNRNVTAEDPACYGDVREMILVPLSAGEKRFGWLAAFNHTEQLEFGTVEASLLSSVAAILGIHAGNVELYHEQTDLLSGVVRALSSAIDAKDPYTRGHSDRVARVAVRLTRELGYSTEFQNTVYLSGLLHDIGKIGIEDEVLRKPGQLSQAEFEHIKLHPEIGYKILVGLKKFDNVLPGVLHHHEAWDGSGYPHGLAGEQIPLMARIIAVADAFDAMGSDRPYRKGMDEKHLDEILRQGAGTQWDAEVVDAFFKARSDIREIARHDRDSFSLDLQQWA